MTNRDAEETVQVCPECGGSGMKAVGCNLFTCPACNGDGASESGSEVADSAKRISVSKGV